MTVKQQPKIKSILLILFIALVPRSFAQSGTKNRVVTLKEFNEELDSLGLVFDMPKGYEATIVKENRDLYYGFAIKNKKADFEIRYSVWSLQPEMEQYNVCLKDPNCTMLHPDKFFLGRAEANVLNMTAGADAKIGPFPTSSVKEEFNANAGGSSFFKLDCQFGEGYQFGQMVYLHKDGVADVIITYLSNDIDKHVELMNAPFHALRFK